MNTHKDILILVEISMFVFGMAFFIGSFNPKYHDIGWVSFVLFISIYLIEIHKYKCWLCN